MHRLKMQHWLGVGFTELEQYVFISQVDTRVLLVETSVGAGERTLPKFIITRALPYDFKQVYSTLVTGLLHAG